MGIQGSIGKSLPTQWRLVGSRRNIVKHFSWCPPGTHSCYCEGPADWWVSKVQWGWLALTLYFVSVVNVPLNCGHSPILLAHFAFHLGLICCSLADLLPLSCSFGILFVPSSLWNCCVVSPSSYSNRSFIVDGQSTFLFNILLAWLLLFVGPRYPRFWKDNP